MSLKHTMTMFIADRKMNELMRCFDMRIDCKQFIEPQEATFTLKEGVVLDEAFFINIIRKSKELMDGYWIPAIRYQDNFFYHPEVKVLSDGRREFFIQQFRDSAL